MDAVSGTTAQTGVTPSAAATWQGIAGGGGGGDSDLFIPASRFAATGAGAALTSVPNGLSQWASLDVNTSYHFDTVVWLSQAWKTFDINIWYYNGGGDTDNYVTWKWDDQWLGTGDGPTNSNPTGGTAGNFTPPGFGDIAEIKLTAAPRTLQAGKLYNLRITHPNSPNTSPRQFIGARLAKVT